LIFQWKQQENRPGEVMDEYEYQQHNDILLKERKKLHDMQNR
jgi:hypothetical protein